MLCNLFFCYLSKPVQFLVFEAPLLSEYCCLPDLPDTRTGCSPRENKGGYLAIFQAVQSRERGIVVKLGFSISQSAVCMCLWVVATNFWTLMLEMWYMFVSCSYVGRSFVKGGGRPTDILEKLNEMAGFAPTEEIQLYEVSFYPVLEHC